MITITPAAAGQIQASSEQGNMQGLAMRIAAKRNELDGDMHINAGGIDIVIGESSHLLMEGATLDYVEIEPETWQFIFLNPNDANYSPPA